MQEKKHPLLSFLMPPAVGVPRYAWRGLGVARLRRRAGLLLAQAFATLRVTGFIALRRDRDAVSLSCSCKKVTKEARQRGRRSHAAAPFGIPFWLLVQFVILLRRW